MGKFDQVSASKDPSESSFFSSSTENMYRFWFTCNLILIGIFYGTACTNLRVFVDGNIGSDSLCGSSLVSLCEFAGSPLSSFFLSFLPTFFSIQVSRPLLPRPLNVFSGWPWPTWAILLLPPWSHQRTFKFTTLSNFSSANDKLQRKKIIFMLVLSFISQMLQKWAKRSRKSIKLDSRVSLWKVLTSWEGKETQGQSIGWRTQCSPKSMSEGPVHFTLVKCQWK